MSIIASLILKFGQSDAIIKVPEHGVRLNLRRGSNTVNRFGAVESMDWISERQTPTETLNYSPNSVVLVRVLPIQFGLVHYVP
jgi:hypothetical protein